MKRLKRTKEFDLKCIELYTKENKSSYQIGREMSCSFGTVLNILREYKQTIKPKKSYKKYKINEEFFNVLGENQAYFLGIMFSDGHNSKNGRSFEIALQERDIDILQKLKKILDFSGPITTINNNRGFNGGKAVRLRVCSKKLNQDLIKFGCFNNKTKILDWPEYLPDDLVRHFLRGFMDGDGGITITKFSSRFYIYGLKNICDRIDYIIKNNFNIHCIRSLYKKKNMILHGISIRGNKQVLKVLDWLYQGSTIYLQRKYNRYLEIKSWYEKDLIQCKKNGVCPECLKEKRLSYRTPKLMCRNCYEKFRRKNKR